MGQWAVRNSFEVACGRAATESLPVGTDDFFFYPFGSRGQLSIMKFGTFWVRVNGSPLVDGTPRLKK